MKGEVIGQVFESRSEQHDVSFAHLLVEQQWCAVREACCHARLPLFRYCGVENLHLSPTAVIRPGLRFIQRRIAEVHLPYGSCASLAPVIMGVFHTTTPQWNLRMVADGGAKCDQDSATLRNILPERVLKNPRQRHCI